MNHGSTEARKKTLGIRGWPRRCDPYLKCFSSVLPCFRGEQKGGVMERRKFVKGAVALGAAATVPAWAQQGGKFPSKPIRFVVPFSAGGGGDVVARMLAQRLSERLNNPVVVENRTGAGGNI